MRQQETEGSRWICTRHPDEVGSVGDIRKVGEKRDTGGRRAKGREILVQSRGGGAARSEERGGELD